MKEVCMRQVLSQYSDDTLEWRIHGLRFCNKKRSSKRKGWLTKATMQISCFMF